MKAEDASPVIKLSVRTNRKHSWKNDDVTFPVEITGFDFEIIADDDNIGAQMAELKRAMTMAAWIVREVNHPDLNPPEVC